MDLLRSVVDCLLTGWFIMGNMWVFGGRPPSTCPCVSSILTWTSTSFAKVMNKLQKNFLGHFCGPIARLVTDGTDCRHFGHLLSGMMLVMLTVVVVSCAVPVVVCTALCCCMPPVIRALYFQNDEDDTISDLEFQYEYLTHKLHGRAGASEAAIHALPLLTFAAAPLPSTIQDSLTAECSTACDAKATCCCICLERYEEGARVREMPCTHRFHMACVDEWLRISATCPLCKHNINQFAPEELMI